MVTRDGSGIANKASRNSRIRASSEKRRKRGKKKKRNTKSILTAGISLNKYEDGAVWNLVAPTWRLNAPRVNKLVFSHAKFKEGRGDQFALLRRCGFTRPRWLICDPGAQKWTREDGTKAKKARSAHAIVSLSFFDRCEPPRSFKISKRRSENKPRITMPGRVNPANKTNSTNASTRGSRNCPRFREFFLRFSQPNTVLPNETDNIT